MRAIEAVSGPAPDPIFAAVWTANDNVRLAGRRPTVQAAMLLSIIAISAGDTQELSGVSWASARERGGTERPQPATIWWESALTKRSSNRAAILSLERRVVDYDPDVCLLRAHHRPSLR